MSPRRRVDPDSPEFAALARAARETFDPQRIVSVRRPGGALVPGLPAAGPAAPAVAHVCRDRRCEHTATGPEELTRYIS